MPFLSCTKHLHSDMLRCVIPLRCMTSGKCTASPVLRSYSQPARSRICPSLRFKAFARHLCRVRTYHHTFYMRGKFFKKGFPRGSSVQRVHVAQIASRDRFIGGDACREYLASCLRCTLFFLGSSRLSSAGTQRKFRPAKSDIIKLTKDCSV